MAQPKRVTLGKVAGVFGVKGWVKVHSYTRPMENILGYRKWWLGDESGFSASLAAKEARVNGLFVQLTGRDGEPIVDREVAASLIGTEISVDRAELPPAAPGEYYWADLIGLAVESVAGEPLGRVEDMMENGAQDVLILRDGEIERLIPFVREAIIQSVDLAAGKIVADWSPDY